MVSLWCTACALLLLLLAPWLSFSPLLDPGVRATYHLSTPSLEVRLKVNITLCIATDLDVFFQRRILWVLIHHHAARMSSVVGKDFPEGTIQHGLLGDGFPSRRHTVGYG